MFFYSNENLFNFLWKVKVGVLSLIYDNFINWHEIILCKKKKKVIKDHIFLISFEIIFLMASWDSPGKCFWQPQNQSY